jgi:hypothetical protein
MTTLAIDPLPGEKWEPIPGWEDRYWISTAGRVASLPYVNRKSIRILTVGISTTGYPYVNLGHPSRQRRLHALLLTTFVGPRPSGMFALHNDDDPNNFDLSNLRWGTRSENSFDAVRNGLHPQASKTHCKRGHPLVEANLRQTAKGRYCLTCYRDWLERCKFQRLEHRRQRAAA